MIRCKCGRKFKTDQIFNMHKPYCKGALYCQNSECGKLLVKLQKKFCSSSCSAKVTVVGRKHSIETRTKISKSLGGTGEYFDKTCLNCGTKIKSEKYCSTKCQHEHLYKEKIKDWLKNQVSIHNQNSS